AALLPACAGWICARSRLGRELRRAPPDRRAALDLAHDRAVLIDAPVAEADFAAVRIIGDRLLREHFAERVKRVAVENRGLEPQLVQTQLVNRVLAGILHRQPDYQRGGDAAEDDPMLERRGRHQMLVEM